MDYEDWQNYHEWCKWHDKKKDKCGCNVTIHCSKKRYRSRSRSPSPCPTQSGTLFHVHLVSDIPAVTGDGTAYQIPFNGVDFNLVNGNPSTNFNTTTGVYTVSEDGYYSIYGRATLTNGTSGNTSAQLNLITTGSNPQTAKLDFIDLSGPNIIFTQVVPQGEALLKLKMGDTLYLNIIGNGNLTKNNMLNANNTELMANKVASL